MNPEACFAAMKTSRRFPAFALALAALVAASPAAPKTDPLADDIARWQAFVENNKSTDEGWTQLKQAVVPLLARASDALRDGNRWLALQRMAVVRPNLAARAYREERSAAALQDEAAFEAEWERAGKTLQRDLAPPSGSALDGVRPAALRALGEAALPQVRAYYESSLEYARATKPEYGYLYVGTAYAERDFAAFCRTLSEPSTLRPPAVRPIGPELDALEAELLTAYRPPASIDRHGEFIGASATLKEARELDAAGLRYGALLRYVQALLRFAPLRPESSAIPAEELSRRLDAFAGQLSSGGVDHTIGQIFLAAARADLASAKPGARTPIAEAAAADLLPKYLAAVGPAPKRPPKAAPEVTVTLVRWPYT